MRTLGLNYALVTLGLLLVACPGGGNDDELGEGSTDEADSGDGDGDTMGTESGTSTADDDTTSSTDAETTDAETTDAETTDAETTGDGDGDCAGEGIGICDVAPESDGFGIDSMAIEGDCLTLHVNYGGGCADHTFTSCWDQSFAESNPVQAWLWIDHDAMNDPCDAIVQDTWIIDLTSMKEAWQLAYQSQTGTIVLHVGGQSIDYDF